MDRPTALIPAEVWSGNLAIKAKFDAAQWFARARGEQIGALAACGWSGQGNDDSLVGFFEPIDVEVSIVVDYARRRRTSVVFRVDADAAIAWMMKNRAHLLAQGSGTGTR